MYCISQSIFWGVLAHKVGVIQECFMNTRWSTTYLKFIPLCCKVSVTCYSQTRIPYELQRIHFLSALQFLVKSCTFVWWKLCVPSADFVPWDWSLLSMTTRLRQASYSGMTETLEVFLRDLLLIKSCFLLQFTLRNKSLPYEGSIIRMVFFASLVKPEVQISTYTSNVYT